MKTTGIILAIAGLVVLVVYILYKIFMVIAGIPFWIKVGLVLLIIGGILVLISLIRERIGDSKKESFKGIKK